MRAHRKRAILALVEAETEARVDELLEAFAGQTWHPVPELFSAAEALGLERSALLLGVGARFAEQALTLHLGRSEGGEPIFRCELRAAS